MSINGLLNSFDLRLEPAIKHHLKNVYASLAMCVLSASAGAYVHLFTNFLRGGGLLFSLLGAGLAMAVYFTPDDGKNRLTRGGMLLGFAFLSGLGIGPVLDIAIRVNPTIVPSALLLSAGIFASFSGVALYSPDGKYLYLGGTLLSCLSTMFWMSLFAVFFQSKLIFEIYVWMGLALFCGFIVWDTQMIIEKRRRGDRDFIIHSLDLFIDFVQVFRRILSILIQKEDNKKQRKQQ